MSATLNDKIATVFRHYSPEFEHAWQIHSPIKESQGLFKDIMAVNNYLRIQLGLLDADTTEERQCLANDVNLDEWIDNFEDVVAPTIVRYQLPDWQ